MFYLMKANLASSNEEDLNCSPNGKPAAKAINTRSPLKTATILLFRLLLRFLGGGGEALSLRYECMLPFLTFSLNFTNSGGSSMSAMSVKTKQCVLQFAWLWWTGCSSRNSCVGTVFMAGSASVPTNTFHFLFSYLYLLTIFTINFIAFAFLCITKFFLLSYCIDWDMRRKQDSRVCKDLALRNFTLRDTLHEADGFIVGINTQIWGKMLESEMILGQRMNSCRVVIL